MVVKRLAVVEILQASMIVSSRYMFSLVAVRRYVSARLVHVGYELLLCGNNFNSQRVTASRMQCIIVIAHYFYSEAVLRYVQLFVTLAAYSSQSSSRALLLARFASPRQLPFRPRRLFATRPHPRSPCPFVFGSRNAPWRTNARRQVGGARSAALRSSARLIAGTS